MVQSDHYVLARGYLACMAQSPWRWDEGGRVIAWANGETIAFREELEGVLQILTRRGLPPMMAVVLLMAACRDSWGETSSVLGTMAGFLASVERRDVPEWLAELFARLDVVNRLPADLRASLEAKQILAEAVFENAQDRMSPDASRQIVETLKHNVDPGLLAPRERQASEFGGIFGALRSLLDGLKGIDQESLRRRHRTGLDQLVQPAEIDLEPGERVRRLIAQLQDDDEAGAVARMAARLMAAVHLPRAISDHEDLPLGGVSDISNRGSLDRLLVSELAHDNLTLAVRVAMNEALYLRRESPPRTPPRSRAVLVDCGIRLWGIPRVFATAVALAVAAKADRETPVGTYRASGRSIVPIDLSRPAGLAAHLAAIEPEAHPGEALPPFFEALAKTSHAAEPLLVTGDEVAADPSFQRALSAAACCPILLATVNRQGHFRIVLRTHRGTKAICEARLDLAQLLSGPQHSRSPLVDPRALQDLPAIFRATPFPLFLSCRADYANSWAHGDRGLLSVAKDGRLLYYQFRDCGGRQLLEKTPAGALLWAGFSPDYSVAYAVIGRLQQSLAHLLVIHPQTGDVRTQPLDMEGRQPIGIAGHGGVLFAIERETIAVLEMKSGRCVETIAILPQTKWRRDRFFEGREGYFALSYDGCHAQFELLPNSSLSVMPRYVTVFDGSGEKGPLALTHKGELYSLTTGRCLLSMQPDLNRPIAPVRRVIISRDNQRLLVETGISSDVVRTLIDVEKGTQARLSSKDSFLIESPRGFFARQDLQKRFTGVTLDDEGQLVLIRPRKRGCLVRWNRNQFDLDSVGTDAYGKRPPIAFEPLARSPSAGYQLAVAKTADGSRIVLDSRGLLHLKSSDAAIAEMTIVLASGGNASGWCSDGRMFGRVFFLGGRKAVAAEAIYREVYTPFLAKIR